MGWRTASCGVVCAGALVLQGCGERTRSLADIPVARATLSGFTDVGFVMMGGGRLGSARLTLVEPSDERHAIDISMSGGMVGPMMEVGVSILAAEADFDLSAIDDPHGDDVLGPYEGFSASGAVLLGGAVHDIENDRHARLFLGGFQFDFGVSMMVGHEWLVLDVGPERACDDAEDNDVDGDTDCDDTDCSDACGVDAGVNEPPRDAGADPDAGIVDGGQDADAGPTDADAGSTP